MELDHEELKEKLLEWNNIHNNGKPILLLKFCKQREYVEDIKNGKLYLNTVEFFRNLEEKTGSKDKGDDLECMFIDPETKKRTQVKDDEKVSLFSFFGINVDEIKIIDYKMKDNNIMTIFYRLPEEKLEEFIDIFGDNCITIWTCEFEKKISSFLKESEYHVGNCIYKEPTPEKIYEFIEGSPERFLYKTKTLAYQHEYRFIYLNKIPENHYLEIGEFEEKGIFDSKELLTATHNIDVLLSQLKLN